MSGGPAVWTLPAAWHAVDFISDLHLSPAMPATRAAFEHWIARTTADAVCILGDLFETWVGDDARHQPFESGVVDCLARAARRCELLFMAGNRDFLVGTELSQAAGLRLLPDPTTLEAWGQRWVLSHGDALCLGDHAYQAFRSEVRSAAWQQRFLAQPLAQRLATARQMREASRQHQRAAVEGTGDVDDAACLELLHRQAACVLLHGHTHRPADHELGAGLSRKVLSDWDCDNPDAARCQVLRLTRQGAVRLTPVQTGAR